MNPFEAHGIEHLSPSACTQFVSAPAMFVLQRLLKLNTSVGPAAHRGTSVETGVVKVVSGKGNLADGQAAAMSQFLMLTALIGDPRTAKEEGGIKEMVARGVEELQPYGPPSSTQVRLEYKFDDVAVPLIGFYDFEWEKRNLILDLKTTWALPSQISLNHARQVSFYCAAKSGTAATNVDGRVTYVTPKKAATYRLENIREHVESIHKIALTIQRFLALSADPQVLAGLVVPDVDSFYYNDPITRQHAFDVWGI